MTSTHRAPREQTTLRGSITLAGVGMHTGEHAEVTVSPAPPNSGIQFIRGARRFPAGASFVVGTRRCTCLGDGSWHIDTVEHLLASLAGMHVDNADISVSGPEIPILDGSALPWVNAISAAGVEALDVPARALTLTETIALRDGNSWLTARPAGRFSLTCVTHFDHPLLGTQSATFTDDPEQFAAHVAPARTFGFAREIEALHAAGLARGGTLDNALVIFEDRFSSELRVPDECLRHKALDLFGDLSLAGALPTAYITAIMPGHRINAEFASMLRERGTWTNG